MADNVIELKLAPKELDKVFSCGCGCQLFYLNGSVLEDRIMLECKSCGSVVSNMEILINEFGENE